jgi:hypothetical protein
MLHSRFTTRDASCSPWLRDLVEFNHDHMIRCGRVLTCPQRILVEFPDQVVGVPLWNSWSSLIPQHCSPTMASYSSDPWSPRQTTENTFTPTGTSQTPLSTSRHSYTSQSGIYSIFFLPSKVFSEFSRYSAPILRWRRLGTQHATNRYFSLSFPRKFSFRRHVLRRQLARGG